MFESPNGSNLPRGRLSGSFLATFQVAILAAWVGASSLGASRACAQPSDSEPVPLEAFARAAQIASSPHPTPRLVVILLIDQYREDYLDRFRSVFGRDGFRRLEAEGARFTDCTIPYNKTVTSPAHATLVTGATPRVHGIVGNSWYERGEGIEVTSTFDSRVRSVGVPDEGEPASPARLRAQTLGDVLRAVTRGGSKVVAISDKARAAVLAGGRRPTGVYWLDEGSGLMQTSSYYTEELPAWAQAANAARRPQAALAEPWAPLLAPEAYIGAMGVEGIEGFPHVPNRESTGNSLAVLARMPFALTSLFRFAEAALSAEHMGEDEIPDLLVLSVSVTDRVGHRYGPDSPEVLDLAARLDREVASLLRSLDQRIGRDRYTVCLTSDHGVVPAPSIARLFAVGPDEPAGVITDSEVSAWVDRVLGPVRQGKGSKPSTRMLAASEGYIWLDEEALVRSGTTLARAARTLADSAWTNPQFAGGYTAEDLLSGCDDHPLAVSARHGYFRGRSGDVVLLPRVNTFFGGGPTLGTSHGSPYRYDTHVPLLFAGWGVRAGIYRSPVSTIDIAPTLATIFGVDAPAQSEGRPLVEALTVPEKRGAGEP